MRRKCRFTKFNWWHFIVFIFEGKLNVISILLLLGMHIPVDSEKCIFFTWRQRSNQVESWSQTQWSHTVCFHLVDWSITCCFYFSESSNWFHIKGHEVTDNTWYILKFILAYSFKKIFLSYADHLHLLVAWLEKGMFHWVLSGMYGKCLDNIRHVIELF